MSRTDYINSVIIGEIIAFFILLLIFTLNSEIPTNLFYLESYKWMGLLIFPVLGTCFVYSISKFREKFFVLSQFGKFCYVGFSNLTIDFGILNLLIYYTGIDSGIYYSVFKAVSFLFAVINSYLWNKFWTFNNGYDRQILKQFIKFLSVLGIGMIINVAIASYIVNEVNPPVAISTKLWANVGAIVSLIFTLSWNFLGMKFLVFKDSNRML